MHGARLVTALGCLALLPSACQHAAPQARTTTPVPATAEVAPQPAPPKRRFRDVTIPGSHLAAVIDEMQEPACVHPDDGTLAKLEIVPIGELRPNDREILRLGSIECCTYFHVVNACATWTLEPAVGTIEPDGELRVAASAAHGTVLQVTADVDGGRRKVSHLIQLYTQEKNPFVGTWREVGEYDCGGSGEVLPVEAIKELEFRANGRFFATWVPFETFVDFAGWYQFDPSRAEIVLTVEPGDRVPPDIVPRGTYAFGANGLELRSVWLGTRSPPPRCGHRFVRTK